MTILQHTPFDEEARFVATQGMSKRSKSINIIYVEKHLNRNLLLKI